MILRQAERMGCPPVPYARASVVNSLQVVGSLPKTLATVWESAERTWSGAVADLFAGIELIAICPLSLDGTVLNAPSGGTVHFDPEVDCSETPSPDARLLAATMSSVGRGVQRGSPSPLPSGVPQGSCLGP